MAPDVKHDASTNGALLQQLLHPQPDFVSSSDADTLAEGHEPANTIQDVKSMDGNVVSDLSSTKMVEGLGILEQNPSPGSTSWLPVRPSVLAKSESEAPKRASRGPDMGLRRFATASQTPASQLGLSYIQGKDADLDSSSDSSGDEDISEELRRQESKQKRKKEDKQHNKYSRFRLGNDFFSTTGKVRKHDGRLNISVNETDISGYLAKALGTGFRHHFFHPDEKTEKEEVAGLQRNAKELDKEADLTENLDQFKGVPRLNIVIIVIGSRGDIQPFLKVGNILHKEYGHRVRIATHPAFKEFVENDGALEFFSVGGDPSELMAFMVKNPGLIPSIETIKAGEIAKRREQMAEMFEGMWRACINASDDETNKGNMKMMGMKDPFVADAIIANPPSFAHIHIAERLGIPLHLMFTFPYTPTTAFPHPLANIQSTNVDHAYANFMSYPLVELMTWQGLGDLINKFRVHTLGLGEVSTLWAPGMVYRLKVAFTYMWSPGLVTRPRDYGPNIDISGFVFLDLGSSFEPPEDLQKFLDAGEPPVYIGFGSIVVDDPNAFTSMIFEAVKLAGVRALVSKGWGGLGRGDIDMPENIFLLDNTPHDWLFPRVSAVVHHGGAGTTAIGLKCGKPTMIVPFFGDQPFWGAMVARKRAGAFECIPYKKLNAEKLAEGIKQCLTDEARENVEKIAERIAKEGDGAHNAVKSFHKHLNLSGSRSIRCSILENRVAVWSIKTLGLRLSTLAASMLVEQRKIRWQDLRLVRHVEWNDFEGPGGPITGVVGPILGTLVDAGMGMASIPYNAQHSIKYRRKHKAKKRRLEERRKKLKEINGNTDTPKPIANGRANLQRQITGTSTLSADPSEPLAEELAKETGHGFWQAGKAIANLPMNIGVGITQGFHNAPRLYGDETVRKPVRITGIQSGLRAGRDEFVYGIWDGFTGIVTQPYHGAKEHGVVGALEGTAVGIGGFFLKNIAAIIGPFAYAAKGIEKEMSKSKQPTKFIRKSRMIQGSKELRALEDAVHSSREDVLKKTESSDIFCPLEDETLESVQSAVNGGWKIVMELLDVMYRKKSEGPLKIKGKVGLWVAEKKWHDSGAMENVRTVNVALEAKRAGKDIGEELEKYRQRKE
jgi:UDP:flavonoid glycosyltransferase YjiC (YdhE family)